MTVNVGAGGAVNQNPEIQLVGLTGIEPSTEGLWGGCIRSEWSGDVGFIRNWKKTCPVVSDWSGGVGLVCGMKRGIF